LGQEATRVAEIATRKTKGCRAGNDYLSQATATSPAKSTMFYIPLVRHRLPADGDFASTDDLTAEAASTPRLYCPLADPHTCSRNSGLSGNSQRNGRGLKSGPNLKILFSVRLAM
jgi:hypothetical protein